MAFKKIKAFTLAESLLALLTLTIVCLLFQTGISQLKYVQKHSFSTHHEDFQVFLLQLAYETKEMNFINMTSSVLVFETVEQNIQRKICTFELKNNIIRKSLNNGYQPLLMNVKSWQLIGNAKSSHVAVTFLNDETYEGVVTY